MGEAAKISLKAIGKQDTYLLSKDPDESFFNYTENKRHTDFRKYHRSKLNLCLLVLITSCVAHSLGMWGLSRVGFRNLCYLGNGL